MSQEAVELLGRVVDALNTGELPRDLIAPDFRLTNATTAVTDATYSGYDGALKWRRDFFDVIEDACFRVDEILATSRNYVVIANRLIGRGASSGAPVDMRWASVLWFRDGKLARVGGYHTRRDALEAVGLGD